MRYVNARTTEYVREKIYRIYVTDALQYINGSMTNALGGKSLTTRYSDLITPAREPDKTADEVITSIKDKLRALGK